MTKAVIILLQLFDIVISYVVVGFSYQMQPVVDYPISQFYSSKGNYRGAKFLFFSFIFKLLDIGNIIRVKLANNLLFQRSSRDDRFGNSPDIIQAFKINVFNLDSIGYYREGIRMYHYFSAEDRYLYLRTNEGIYVPRVGSIDFNIAAFKLFHRDNSFTILPPSYKLGIRVVSLRYLRVVIDSSLDFLQVSPSLYLTNTDSGSLFLKLNDKSYFGYYIIIRVISVRGLSGVRGGLIIGRGYSSGYSCGSYYDSYLFTYYRSFKAIEAIVYILNSRL